MAPVGQYLRYSEVFDEQANLRVLALAAALAASRPDGVREIYPGYGSVYVEWEDATLPNERAAAWIDRDSSAPVLPCAGPSRLTARISPAALTSTSTALSGDRTVTTTPELFPPRPQLTLKLGSFGPSRIGV